MDISLGVVLLSVLIASCSGKTEWNYDDPKTWGENFAACKKESSRQSPIDFSPKNTIVDSIIPDIKFYNYEETIRTVSIKNDGHTAKVSIPAEGKIQISGGNLPGTYNLLQFHFHWSQQNDRGSEHTSNKLHYPLEMHLVHLKDGLADPLKSPDGGAVVGVFFHLAAEDNPLLDPVVRALNGIQRSGVNTTISNLKLSDLMPRERSYFYRYLGSLTSPPCFEAIVWTVLQQTVPISQRQLNAFRRVRDNRDAVYDNFRPVQSLSKRIIKLRVPAEKQISGACSQNIFSFSIIVASVLFSMVKF